MITIETKKGKLDTDANFGISLNIISPLFKDSIVQESYSYPISLPITERNKKILNYTHRLDSAEQWDKYPCQVFYKGILVIEGSLQIQNIDERKISAFISEYSFDTAVLEKSIKEIDLGGVRSIVPTLHSEMHKHANELVHATSDTSDYVFAPIKNNIFYEDNPAALGLAGSAAPHTYSGIINLWDFRLQSFFQFPEIARCVNDFGAGNMGAFEYQQFQPALEYDVKQSTMIPFPFVVAILKYIAKHLNLTLSGGWVQDEEVKRMIIYNNFCLDSYDNTTFPFFKNNADINLANHLPNISIKDFLDALKNTFNLAVSINSEELRIDTKKYLLGSPDIQHINLQGYSTATENNNPGIISLTQDNADDGNAFGEIDATQVLEDGDFSVNATFGDIRFDPALYDGRKYLGSLSKSDGTPSGYRVNLGGTNNTTAKLGTLKTQKLSIDYAYVDSSNTSVPTTYQSGIIPVCNQKGTSVAYNFQNDFSLRILIYRGMHPDPNGFGDYPFASENVYDDNANIIGNTSLKWKGGAFSLEKWWQITYGNKVTFSTKMTALEFLNFDLLKKVKVLNRWYVPKNIKATLTHSGLGKVTIETIEI